MPTTTSAGMEKTVPKFCVASHIRVYACIYIVYTVCAEGPAITRRKGVRATLIQMVHTCGVRMEAQYMHMHMHMHMHMLHAHVTWTYYMDMHACSRRMAGARPLARALHAGYMSIAPEQEG